MGRTRWWNYCVQMVGEMYVKHVTVAWAAPGASRSSPNQRAVTAELRENLDREARVVSTPDHPSNCRAFDGGHYGGFNYLCYGIFGGRESGGPAKKRYPHTDCMVSRYALQFIVQGILAMMLAIFRSRSMALKVATSVAKSCCISCCDASPCLFNSACTAACCVVGGKSEEPLTSAAR